MKAEEIQPKKLIVGNTNETDYSNEQVLFLRKLYDNDVHFKPNTLGEDLALFAMTKWAEQYHLSQLSEVKGLPDEDDVEDEAKNTLFTLIFNFAKLCGAKRIDSNDVAEYYNDSNEGRELARLLFNCVKRSEASKVIASLQAQNKWIPVSERLPITYETGGWDGKRSDIVLCRTKDGEFHLSRLYDYGDGTSEWYDKRDFDFAEIITHWQEINEPTKGE